MVQIVADELPGNPLDIIEELVSANDWSFERPTEAEIVVQVRGQWCDYHLYIVWFEEFVSVVFSCHFDQRIGVDRRRPIYELIGLANERLWIGHFDLLSDEGAAVYRHTVPMRGLQHVSVEILEDLIDAAVSECDRFYPALQLVLWSDKSPKDAIDCSIMETVGEA